MMNKASLTNRLCEYAIAGIIHLLQTSEIENDFSTENCIKTGTSYHQIDIIDWLIINYQSKLDIFTSIKAFNYLAFSFL